MLESVVETAETPDVIRRIRNLILLSKKLDSIEPELLGHMIDSVPEGLARASAKRTAPPGLFSLVQKFSSKESRRALAVAAEILETFGRRLGSGSSRMGIQPNGSSMYFASLFPPVKLTRIFHRFPVWSICSRDYRGQPRSETNKTILR